MKKWLLLIFTLFSILPEWSFSESFNPWDRLWLSVFFELQESKMKVEEEIKQIDLMIAKNEQEIHQINALLAKIQRAMIAGDEKQKQDAQQAKLHAEEALMTAKMTQKKLKEQKIELAWQKTQIEQKEARLREIYSKITTSPNLAGLIKECSGNVKIIKSKGNKSEDTCSSFIYMPVSEGDIITTSSDGRLELKILDGRGNFIIGPNSSVLVKRNSEDAQIFELIDGKVHIKSETTNEISKKLNEYIQNYKKDLNTITDWIDEKIEEFRKEIKKFKINLKIELCRKHLQRCPRPEWVIGVRGTEFTVKREGESIVKILVIEGEVELNDNIKNKSDLIPEGYETIIEIGETVTKRKIEKLERWWEK